MIGNDVDSASVSVDYSKDEVFRTKVQLSEGPSVNSVSSISLPANLSIGIATGFSFADQKLSHLHTGFWWAPDNQNTKIVVNHKSNEVMKLGTAELSVYKKINESV